jgi:hypothetical protein
MLQSLTHLLEQADRGSSAASRHLRPVLELRNSEWAKKQGQQLSGRPAAYVESPLAVGYLGTP